jgi:hypothetical protein
LLLVWDRSVGYQLLAKVSIINIANRLLEMEAWAQDYEVAVNLNGHGSPAANHAEHTDAPLPVLSLLRCSWVFGGSFGGSDNI